MLIKITKNKTCDDSFECNNDILQKLKTKYPNLILEAKTKDDQPNGHLSISHEKNSHTYWIFVYEKSGINEQESEGKIVKTKSDRVKKYTGTMPTESEIKKLL